MDKFADLSKKKIYKNLVFLWFSGIFTDILVDQEILWRFNLLHWIGKVKLYTPASFCKKWTVTLNCYRINETLDLGNTLNPILFVRFQVALMCLGTTLGSIYNLSTIHQSSNGSVKLYITLIAFSYSSFCLSVLSSLYKALISPSFTSFPSFLDIFLGTE